MKQLWKDRSIQWNDLLETTDLNSDELEKLFNATEKEKKSIDIPVLT